MILPTSRHIRIAYVVHAFHAGGLERSVARLANGLDRRRFAPVIVCLDRSGAAADWIEADDVPIVELRKGSGNSLGVVARLASTLHRLGIDVAHSHNWGTLLETAVACRLIRPRVRHVHAERGTVLGQIAGSGYRYRARSAVLRQAVKRVDCLLSNAVATGDRVAATAGIAASAVHLIPNGLDAPIAEAVAFECERRRIRHELRLADDVVLAGSIGRLVPVKDLASAIRAVAVAVRGGAFLHFVLVGDGDERDRLKATAEKECITDRVHFVGEQTDVGPWLAAMDLYLNTSLSEGMSQSVVEAMSMGLPLIVTDVGDHRRLAEGGGCCGNVVRPGDIGALAHALRELCEQPELRRARGGQAKVKHAAEHSLAVMMARYELLYEDLVWSNGIAADDVAAATEPAGPGGGRCEDARTKIR